MVNENLNELLKKYLYILFVAVLVIFFIGDIGRKVALILEQDFIRYTAISKGLVLLLHTLVFICFFKIYKSSTTSLNLLVCVFLLTAVFVLGQCVLKDNTPIINRLGLNLVYLSRILFLPLSLAIFFPLLKSGYKVERLFKLFEIIFLLYALSIISGLVFNIWVFETYRWSDRFGYLGLYNSHNQASFFFMFVISIYYYRSVLLKKSVLKLVLAVVVGCLIGTKKMYLFLVLLLLYDAVVYKRYQKGLYLAVVALMASLFVFYYKNIYVFIESRFSELFNIYREQGLITSLTSLRNIALSNTIENVVKPKWSVFNYVFGGSQFYDFRPEMEFVDIYMFFGVFGVVFFIWLIWRLVKLFKPSRFMYFLLGCYVLIGGLAGGFFISANQPLIFLLTFAILGKMHHQYNLNG